MRVLPAIRACAVFLIAAAFALGAGRARAESGLTGAPILNRPIGARSSGMGRAFTGVPGDAESVMYNPAGLGFAPGTGAYMSYMNGFAGGSYGFASVPVKFKGFVLTPAFQYYDSGKMNLDLSDGTNGPVTAELDKVGMISAAYTPVPELAIGATFKFTSINLAEAASASARNYDFGLLYAMANGFSFGAASLNNGDAVKFEEKSDPAPKTLRAGVAYKMGLNGPVLSDFSDYDLVLTSDWSRSYKEKGYYQSGLEVNMKNPSIILSLRLGYLMDRPEEGLTLGVGVKKENWSFGFGYETSKDLDARLLVSVFCGF
ncbi:MAG: PorV/PorQ family protein [Elusimicrobia bacterium]|nr:PorV/PorQ family protein [Elusimicrobiota bacterium]